MNKSNSASFQALGTGGVFEQSEQGFTPRIAQQEMAEAVENTLDHGGTLVAESGTGTGKTFAYLVPIIISGRRTIISTGTRHLQGQIFERDLPKVSRILEHPVNAVLLKGRANYLCHYYLDRSMRQSDLIGESETKSFQLIAQWALKTESGDISEVAEIGEQSPLWKRVTSTTDNCLGGKCHDFKRCFVVKARQQAKKADIVVVNHHLFFSDLTLKDEGFGELLSQYDTVIFDEAHGIAEIASVFFGVSVSTGQIVNLCRDVEATEKEEKSGVKFGNIIAAFKKALQDLLRVSKPFIDQSVDLATLQSTKFDNAFLTLQGILQDLEKALGAAAVAGEGLQDCHERCLSIQDHLDTWRYGGERNLIRWARVTARSLWFHGTPLKIGDQFGKMMSKHARAQVFTSATLAVGNDFSALCNRLGLHSAETRRWDSPYNFQQNTLLYLPPDMPDPRDPGYDDALLRVIDATLRISCGRAFCLFTSYMMMHSVHKKLCAGQAKWNGCPVLLQGMAPKNQLLDRFNSVGNSILFGTSSFWEGVDVKGANLSCVIIDKLPFSSPSDPVLKNRLQACEDEGNNPFLDIQIPEAVIELKQGAGRLIRAETDRGVLVLCDPRIYSKKYGRLFLKSLPNMPITRKISDVTQFFSEDER